MTTALVRHRTIRWRFVAAVMALAAVSAGGAGRAFAQVGEKDDPWSQFRLGYSAYKAGRKAEAFEAYQGAAEKGHAGARWKLATMYASGDGIPEDDYAAFKEYEAVVTQGAAPGTRDGAFVSNALMSLANYLRRGIPDSPIGRDPLKARQLYLQAASQFGDPNAQFQLGHMYRDGEGGPADEVQAARWFNLAASKGHVGSQAMLGQVLFESGHTVRGLSILTSALDRASGADIGWIRALQEEAFAVASEADRRTAIALAQQTTEASQ